MENKKPFLDRVTESFTRFKESPWALVITVGFCALWLILHAVVIHFDPGFYWYQVVLSTDASIVATLFAMDRARQHKHDKQVQKRQELALRGIQALIKAQKVCPYAIEPNR
ncbi:MAG: DUF1003 domain-containing protein [Patescibacteria group bacterium]|nr:DUF1003 domain-containing protein [Patescibacteria group bacterium]